ncbi:MAG: VWA domain-containing protein [Candidatus Hydrogenedentes bacterium]|nr:VWA domain-containing protein [Candidatus Hydrogenedentota bacterium]
MLQKKSRFSRGTLGLFMKAVAVPVLVGAALVGCPAPLLMTSPAAVNFGSISERESFTVYNSGGGTLSWTAREVVWMGAADGWVEQDVAWLSIDPTTAAGSTSGMTSRVFLNASRTGMNPGTYRASGIQIRSNGGTSTVPVVLTVGGTGPDPGDGDVTISPADVVINGLQGVAMFSVANERDTSVQWDIEIANNTSGQDPTLPVQIAAAPPTAVTVSGGSTNVAVSLTDPETFDSQRPLYLISVKEQGTDVLLGQVNVTVDVLGLPAVGVDPATLDFGEDGYQLTFKVANVGDLNSQLDFAVFELNDEVYSPFDVEEDPLILAITASQGADSVPAEPEPTETWLNSREVSVTISRDGIQNDLELRELWIGAVAGLDPEGNPVIDVRITPRKVEVRVAAAATIEGATNRSRPPSVERFVFLIRDKRGVAVDASDELIRNQITFYIKEDNSPLDPDESSMFVQGPENLKCNIVVLLDFTGSMYFAGVNDPVNPLQPGEAIKQMVDAARQFILDLPPNYRIAIMEYHERGQVGRFIHGFDTNKDSLVAALDRFTLPEGENGSSEVYNALQAACEAVVREDPTDVMEFDTADVRAVVFITDGWDTSSSIKDTDLIKLAEDSHVRLYPLGYSGRLSNPVNGALLLDMAKKTGGHSYYAPEVGDIAKALDTVKSLSFGTTKVDTANRRFTLPVRNIGSSIFTARATKDQNWLSIQPPTVSIPPLQRALDGSVLETGVRDMVVSIGSLTAGEHTGSIDVRTEAGDGLVKVVVSVDGAGNISDVKVTPQTLDAGRIWTDLRGQIVLTYTSLFNGDTHRYLIQASFPDSTGKTDTAWFEKDGLYWAGDVRAGQISLTTSGIKSGTAEVFVRADYMPRKITNFQLRFTVDVPETVAPLLTPAQRAELAGRLQDQINAGGVVIVPGGLIDGWRMLPPEGHGVYTIVTEPDQYPPYGAFGNLLKLTFTGLGANEFFRLNFRVDNRIYYSPATDTSPSLTKYFTYPGCWMTPGEGLFVNQNSAMAPPAREAALYSLPFDPEAYYAFDFDGDGWPDFDDADPYDEEVGDADEDGIPDLDDADPNDPMVS